MATTFLAVVSGITNFQLEVHGLWKPLWAGLAEGPLTEPWLKPEREKEGGGIGRKERGQGERQGEGEYEC